MDRPLPDREVSIIDVQGDTNVADGNSLAGEDTHQDDLDLHHQQHIHEMASER